MRLSRRLILACLLLASAAYAQQPDAGQVLAASVTYRTMSAATKLAPDTKVEVEKLREVAMVASQAGRHGDALRHLYHGMSLMSGVAWTPAVELASSLVLKTDHSLWEPGQTIRIRFDQLFALTGTGVRGVRAIARLQGPEPSRFLELNRWPRVSSRWSTSLKVPDVAPGTYRLEMHLSGKDEGPTVLTKRISIVVQPGLRERVQAIRNRLARAKVSPGPALWTAQYIPELFDRADRGDRDPTQFDFLREAGYVEEILTALESGKDPFVNRTGDMRRAYRSDLDGTLQPYRLYVPRSYDRNRDYPLVVALHGTGGDENSLFDRYGNAALIREAERNAYIVVCPKGREPASMYRGPAEKDVLDVLAQVRTTYRVDANRIYMLGHSMGGYGTWSIAMNHPNVFAALAPVAGGGNPAGIGRIRHIPQLVIHGDKDATVPVSAARAMVEAAKKHYGKVKYLEIPGGGHVDIFEPAIPEMFSWFNAHRRVDAPGAVTR